MLLSIGFLSVCPFSFTISIYAPVKSNSSPYWYVVFVGPGFTVIVFIGSVTFIEYVVVFPSYVTVKTCPVTSDVLSNPLTIFGVIFSAVWSPFLLVTNTVPPVTSKSSPTI